MKFNYVSDVICGFVLDLILYKFLDVWSVVLVIRCMVLFELLNIFVFKFLFYLVGIISGVLEVGCEIKGYR